MCFGWPKHTKRRHSRGQTETHICAWAAQKCLPMTFRFWSANRIIKTNTNNVVQFVDSRPKGEVWRIWQSPGNHECEVIIRSKGMTGNENFGESGTVMLSGQPRFDSAATQRAQTKYCMVVCKMTPDKLSNSLCITQIGTSVLTGPSAATSPTKAHSSSQCRFVSEHLVRTTPHIPRATSHAGRHTNTKLQRDAMRVNHFPLHNKFSYLVFRQFGLFTWQLWNLV